MTIYLHSTPDPDLPPTDPKPHPVPDDVPAPTNAPVEEPMPADPPIKAGACSVGRGGRGG